MEENRIIRRARPRPHDLRRKVLLKNFLKEQMTYIPPNQLTSIAPNNSSNFSEESSNSPEIDLQDLNDENDSCSPVSSENLRSDLNSLEKESLPSDSKTIDNSIDKLGNNDDHEKSNVSESTIFKFASLIKLKRKSKVSKAKGILKAKQICKTVKTTVSPKTYRSSIRKAFSKRNRTSKRKLQDESPKPSKSLFSIFKSRKEMKKLKTNDSIQNSTSDSELVNTDFTKFNTTNQSVQTDESWTRDELNKVEQSNRLLREENRLLSESLSYFMSSTSIDSQVNYTRNSNPIQSCSRNSSTFKRFPSYSDLSSTIPNGSRAKVFRSKSVQEHTEKKTISRNNYRSRSMSVHSTQNSFHFLRSNSAASSPNVHPFGISIPRVRKKNILASLPMNTTGRVVRRSSMPERVLSENVRSRVCRRSDSLRSSYRRPFSTLPADAFY